MSRRRFILLFVAVLGPLTVRSTAQSPVEITIGQPATRVEIPSDFVGLSFEISNIMPEKDGFRIFSASNQPLVDLFRVIGIKNLRVGGGTAEPKSGDPAVLAKFAMPGTKDIDALFAFADAADLKIIYTLRLLTGDPAQAAVTASYIASHYGSRLDSFSIGNEPDWHAYHSYPGRQIDRAIFEMANDGPGSAYTSYLKRWREFARAILQAVPDAKFSGPDTGSNYPVTGALDTRYRGKSWTENFAEDMKGSPNITAILAHDYVGQNADGVSISAAIDAMLSVQWPSRRYTALYDNVLARVQAAGFPYRMTECNDHTGGIDGASNAFASALWALDYLHWHAAHGAVGLNFHNKRWIYTCTIVRDASGAFQINPKAYGLKAFSLGSHGRVAPVTIRHAAALNLTAYAVVDDATCCVTIINKEHGPGASSAAVTIVPAATARAASVLSLLAPENDPAARSGITLGGAAIPNEGPWAGRWTPVELDATGRCRVIVPPVSAVVVKLSLR